VSVAFGITGRIAAGKSSLARRVVDAAAARGTRVQHVDCDDLRRAILRGSLDRSAQSDIAALLGTDPDEGQGAWSGLFTSSPGAIKAQNRLALAMRSAICDVAAVSTARLIIDWAMLVEDGFLDLCHGRVIIVDCPIEICRARLAGGDLDAEEVERRIGTQNGRRLARLPAGAEAIRVDGRLMTSDRVMQHLAHWIEG
jgi:dephospho-CoA kinase